MKLFLRRLVREGRPCPPNAEIGRVTGVGGADRARYAIRKLALAGVLRTEVVAPDTGARIVIFADGQRTVFDGIAGK